MPESYTEEKIQERVQKFRVLMACPADPNERTELRFAASGRPTH